MVIVALGTAIVIVLVLAFVLRGGEDEPTATKKQEHAAESTAPDPATESNASDEGIEVDMADGSATYFGQTTFAAGETIEMAMLVRDENGDPVAGVPWFVTVGDPPSSPDAVHAEAVTDDEGRARFELTAPDQVGANLLWTSDGQNDAVQVTEVEIT